MNGGVQMNWSGWRMTAWLLAGALVYLTWVETAHAAAMTVVLCTVVSWFTGTLGRALATLAIIVIGLGATLGKVSWGLAITVAVGITVMLQAPAILVALTGLASSC